MTATFRIRRSDPARSPEPYWEDFEVDVEPGMVVLYALHAIQEEQDGTLAYRFSCRGAICGSCAVRINGAAALACKTQVAELDTSQPIVIEPLLNSDVIRDLVVDQGPFFESLRSQMPWLSDGGRDPHESFTFDETMNRQEEDQFNRSTDCIMCQSCFSDCPKRQEGPSFIGPAACISVFRRVYNPQEPSPKDRLEAACGDDGLYACDKHANCIRVCPKDCRPMRGITMLQRRAKAEGIVPE